MSASASIVEIEFAHPPVQMDAIECEGLLSEAEVEAVLDAHVTPLGRSFSSCYWVGPDETVQLVFNTSNAADHWREQLLETYTRDLHVGDVEVWGDQNSESVAGFGPARGAIVHGVASEEAAVELLLLALSRL
ncbi:MAG: hypothetical protein ABR593_00225 [Candidatus Limnocylindria bacterium]